MRRGVNDFSNLAVYELEPHAIEHLRQVRLLNHRDELTAFNYFESARRGTWGRGVLRGKHSTPTHHSARCPRVELPQNPRCRGALTSRRLKSVKGEASPQGQHFSSLGVVA